MQYQQTHGCSTVGRGLTHGRRPGSPFEPGRTGPRARAFRWSGFVVGVLLGTTVGASAQAPVGVLAIDERAGDRWGWVMNYGSVEAARAAALRECGDGCSVVLTFARCGAYAVDQSADSTAYGWGEAYTSADGARERALIDCATRDGSECLVRAWGCNGSVAEEALGLDAAERRQSQLALRAAGYDPGAADGVFGSRTREAIRNWQAGRGARVTGYLDGATLEVLRGGERAGTVDTPGAVVATPEQENLFWQTIMYSTNVADFEAYLAQFPAGVFARLARNRLTELREPAAETTVEFGDDTSEWARDDECDDPRFEGEGMASSLVFESRGSDATDCERLYYAGRIRLFGVDPDSAEIEFGDDRSDYARNGECDDPRFEGAGTASILLTRDRGHDGTDCRRLHEAGRIRLSGVDIGRSR